MTPSPHAAQSPEFLSRLHDGELSSAERIAFDAHTASCDACRSAVEQFEGSLAAFRSAPTSPPSPDLSARILRKIRAQTPSRRPFGVTFGIDLRLAGVAIAALLAVLIAAPLLVRRKAQASFPAPQQTRAPLSVHLADRETAQKETAAAEAPPIPPDAPRAQPAPARQKAEAERRAAAPAAPPPPAVGQVATDRMRESPAASSKLVARAGGEARSEADEMAGAREDKAVAVRLTVKALDGLGEPPAVDHAPSDPSLSPLRGTEYVLLVEADGRVREAAPSQPAPRALSKPKDAAANAAVSGEPANLFHDLRFAPGDRPRRLLVRVE